MIGFFWTRKFIWKWATSNGSSRK